MSALANRAVAFQRRILESGMTIYQKIQIGDLKYWIPSQELQFLLIRGLRGASLKGLPLRTRSKVVKELVCKSLGYPTPSSFRKTQPRFLGQCFDTYVQKSNNLQIWNEELSPTRRYALIRVSGEDVITTVRVVDGETLSFLDTTGTLTQKYQASVGKIVAPYELVSKKDSDRILSVATGPKAKLSKVDKPTDHPSQDSLFGISELFQMLKGLIGTNFTSVGHDQERNRGGILHQKVCEQLGYKAYLDNGRFPDVRHQLLEVKLQSSPTIDLGLVTPDSEEPLDVPMFGNAQIRHCDVRYAIFCASVAGTKIQLDSLILTTGKDFFKRFKRFEGKVLNKKIQLPLPADFFSDEPE